jgi:hypothetical protein
MNPSPHTRATRTALRIEALEDRLTPVTVRFDFTYDMVGYFNSADRRAALDRVATAITARMTDTLAPIAQAGGNTWTARVYDAASNRTIDIPGLSVAANEVVIYVTAGQLGGGALGLASGGAYSASGTQAWLNTVRNRGQSGADSSSDLGPWGGLVAFSSSTKWDFTAGAPGVNQYDFDSVALHEMMHMFGFGLNNPSFDRLVSGGYFNGPATVSVYGGSVPMQAGSHTDHFAAGTKYGGQESIMNPAIAPGVAKRMTELEYAILRDLGWGSGPQSPPTSPPASPPPVVGVSPMVNTPPSGGLTRLAVGNGTGADTGVNAFGSGGQTVYSGAGFPAGFTGGDRVATADVNGDGVADIVLGAGPGGGPQIRVINGQTGADLYSFFAFELHFRGGVYVAAGDMNGDGKAEVVVGAGEGGGPRVKVFIGAACTLVNDFWGIEDLSFRGGVRVAVGDINGDGYADLAAAAGAGGGPRVAAYDGRMALTRYSAPQRLFNDFFAYDPSLRIGTYITVADVNGDGFGDLVTGAGEGGGPHVKAFNGRSLLRGNNTDLVASFFAGDPNGRSGVRVAAADLNGDGRDDIVAGPGPHSDGTVRVFSGLDFFSPSASPVPYLTLNRTAWATYGAFVG